MNTSIVAQPLVYQSIAIFRAVPGLGDFLCIIPAIRALRNCFPEARIIYIGHSSSNELLERFRDYFDDFIHFPGYPGLTNISLNTNEVLSFLNFIQTQNYDLVIQMHGSGVISNSLIALFNAKKKIGFYVPTCFCPDKTSFIPWIEEESEVLRYVRLFEFLGVSIDNHNLEFPIHTSDWKDFKSLDKVHNFLKKKYICIHVGASTESRRWPKEEFTPIINEFLEKDFEVVLTGSAEERALTESIGQKTQHSCINLAGLTSLGTLALTLSHTCLLICNDTGISHLAAALNTPSVVLFIDSDPKRWAPLNRELHRTVQYQNKFSYKSVIQAAQDLLNVKEYESEYNSKIL